MKQEWFFAIPQSCNWTYHFEWLQNIRYGLRTRCNFISIVFNLRLLCLENWLCWEGSACATVCKLIWKRIDRKERLTLRIVFRRQRVPITPFFMSLLAGFFWTHLQHSFRWFTTSLFWAFKRHALTGPEFSLLWHPLNPFRNLNSRTSSCRRVLDDTTFTSIHLLGNKGIVGIDQMARCTVEAILHK